MLCSTYPYYHIIEHYDYDYCPALNFHHDHNFHLKFKYIYYKRHHNETKYDNFCDINNNHIGQTITLR
ncbi:hypothetical protein SAMD00019534_092730 [Acytostelium subglobosum LB1]|uniref:hypothetical protein n=1 Tax=Acytostelium subglobosum LB1 TaxID=1410327 RepID=UPI000644E88A|nr:hypothetical protein SAMD00019534_092730 [Acytostelium subglobosum LB1]GAM26098.1 hypothetical protein SAMD00019534_092730 [Acytostelium subglobosum LB1]|eukprot:XP_012751141.1 hypothetical protein SAMD00019534_092730 [Acytostelium subglobosum LB1]